MKKKKYSLVFTSILKTWFKNKKNVLIGEWCLTKISNSSYKKFNFIVSRREQQKFKIVSQERLCNYYYERLLNDLILNFQKYYDLKWNKRSWEVFFGPWLHRYVAIIFDRYYALDYVIRNHRIDEVKVAKEKRYNLLTQDHKDFKIQSQTDEWNLKLFSKIFLKYFKKNKINIIKINFPSNTYPIKKNTTSKLNFIEISKNRLLKFFLKLSNNFTKRIYYKSSFGSKKIILFLNLLNKNIPFIYNFDYRLLKIDFVNNIRNQKLKTRYRLNKFEKILRDLFFELLPFYYIEQVDNLKYLRKKLFLPNVNSRQIYTALGLYQENIFKFWLCEALSNKSKLYCLQHGNNYGTSKVLHSEYLEKKMSDKFFTWGWNDKSSNVKKFICTKLIYQKKFKRISSKRIMIVGASLQAYRAEITTGNLFSLRTNIYIKTLKKTLQLLNNINPENIFFRPYPSTIYKNYNLKKELQKLDYIKIDESKLNLLKTLKKFGLVVHVDDGTSFLETMALDKPTMIVMSKELYFDHHRNSASYFYKKLKKVNILHDNPEALVKFIKKINFDYTGWWFSKKTQNAKGVFCSKYCKYVAKPLIQLKKI